MENLRLESTKYTPEVNLNAENASLHFIGKSFPENTADFYRPIKEWLRTYFATEPSNTSVTFQIPYFNSSSSRELYEIFDIFQDASDKELGLNITWEYKENNETAEEIGEEFQEDFEDLNIELVAI